MDTDILKKVKGYALDSNIISFLIKKNERVKRKFDEEKIKESVISIPPFAYYEVKRGFIAAKSTARLREFASICTDYPVGKVSDDVIEEAVNIYADLKTRGINIDDMDVFIAAWCIVHEFTLVTNNIKHFSQINKLKLEDWSAA